MIWLGPLLILFGWLVAGGWACWVLFFNSLDSEIDEAKAVVGSVGAAVVWTLLVLCCWGWLT